MTGASSRPVARDPGGRAADPGPGGGAGRHVGRRLIDANRWFTWAFVVWSALALVVRPLRIVFAGVDVVALVAGCVFYLLAYATAVSRSRSDAIGLGALFFLTDRAAPPAVRRSFWLWTSVQLVVGVAAAAAAPFTPLAFGVLVPIVGLGLMGLWGARHGSFPSRFDDGPVAPTEPGGAGAPPRSGVAASPAATAAEPAGTPATTDATTHEPEPSTRDGAGMEQNDDHG